MIRKITFISMAILVFIPSGFGVSRSFAKTGLADFEEVDAYISTKMKELGIPGAALVIVQGDQIVHLKAFGVADVDRRPVTPQTPFFTGSTGKSSTALAVMPLVEAGQIKLDAPVQTYLPWFRVADVKASEMITSYISLPSSLRSVAFVSGRGVRSSQRGCKSPVTSLYH